VFVMKTKFALYWALGISSVLAFGYVVYVTTPSSPGPKLSEPEIPVQDLVPLEEWPTAFAGQKGGDRLVINVDGVFYRFCWCPPGSFMMGSPEKEISILIDREVLHKVTLSYGFWMLKTEVTQSMWRSIMGNNPSKFNDGDNFPVDSVSWNDAQKFIAKLNERRLAPDGFCFSLPTEAQWEYACRAGTKTPFFWGDSLNGDKANCDGKDPYGTSVKGKSLGRTTPVGSYDANPWGLVDMHGNVAELCEDGYDDYPPGPVIDPFGAGSSRVLRGGGAFDSAENCRSADRSSVYDPDFRSFSYGFRFVLVPLTKKKLQQEETPAEE
jgi:sulfatase modifying factor 1